MVLAKQSIAVRRYTSNTIPAKSANAFELSDITRYLEGMEVSEMNVILEKYHGLGNNYLVFDPNKNELCLNEENIKLICHRNFGVGGGWNTVGAGF